MKTSRIVNAVGRIDDDLVSGATRTKATKESAPKQGYRAESKRKLSFKERKEYESLEMEIMELEEEKSAIEQELCSGTLGNDELLAKSMRIQDVIALIDEKTMRWLELSEFA